MVKGKQGEVGHFGGVPFVTAEIGINHNGDIELAKQLINMAVRCGVDAVKFQKRTVDKVYTKEFLDSPRESPWGTTQREQKNGLEFGLSEYKEVDNYCKKQSIDWFASAWDIDSLNFLKQFDLKYNKIASKMLADREFVEEVAKDNRHTFISVGLGSTKQIDEVVYLFERRKIPFILLHCIMKYPCKIQECSLRGIGRLKYLYSCPVGYSSHHSGTADAVIATTLGAEVIEKHITLDRAMYGTDQPASLEERGLYLVTRNCKLVSKSL